MVDRCICMNSTFQALIATAREHGLGLEGLIEQTGCGERCALCLPFIREALATGRTAFDDDEAQALFAETRASDAQRSGVTRQAD
ncbi:MAG: hypothetical protein CMJ31_06730 [Phycisphaerae bacterium]|nr:hypothetical protein [Phycisphaerae bacterium]